eukprot:1047087-Prorocentrum_minimum.AAC.2
MNTRLPTSTHTRHAPRDAGVRKGVGAAPTEAISHEAAIRAANQAFANMPAWMGVLNCVRSLHTNNGGPIRAKIQQAVEAAQAGNCPDVA